MKTAPLLALALVLAVPAALAARPAKQSEVSPIRKEVVTHLRGLAADPSSTIA